MAQTRKDLRGRVLRKGEWAIPIGIAHFLNGQKYKSGLNKIFF